MKNFILFIAILLIEIEAAACSVCFYGNPDDPAIKALESGILTLLGFLAFIVVLFVAFFIKFSKKSKLMAENQ